MSELLHVSGYTGPSSRSAQLYKTVVRVHYRLQCVWNCRKFFMYDYLTTVSLDDLTAVPIDELTTIPLDDFTTVPIDDLMRVPLDDLTTIPLDELTTSN